MVRFCVLDSSLRADANLHPIFCSSTGRVSLVDQYGNSLYDTFVQPTSTVVSYRPATTGLDSTYFGTCETHTLFLYSICEIDDSDGQIPFADEAVAFKTAQETVARWIMGKIVVGHRLWLNFQVSFVPFPSSLKPLQRNIAGANLLVFILSSSGARHLASNGRHSRRRTLLPLSRRPFCS